MVILGNESRLISLDDGVELIGLSGGPRDRKSVILTTSKSVIVLEVDLQKPISTWNLSFRHSLISPVIYNEMQQQYLGVVSGRILRKWTPEDNFVDKGTKVTLPSDVLSTSPFYTCGESLVVYVNGDIALISRPTISVFQFAGTGRGPIKLVRFCLQRDCDNLAYVAYISDDKQLNVISVDLTSNTVRHHKKQLKFKKGALSVKDMCFSVMNGTEIEVVILYSDGNVACGSSAYLDSALKWRFFDMFKEEIRFGSPKTINHFRDYICLAFQTESLDLTCKIFSLKYESVIQQKTIKLDKSISHLQLHVLDNDIFIFVDGDLFLLPVLSHSSSLASVIGSQMGKHVEAKDVKCLAWTSDGLKNMPEPVEEASVAEQFSSEFLKMVERLSLLGISEQHACAKILEEIQQNHKAEMLADVFKYYQTVPEKSLINTLRFYLKKNVNCSTILSREFQTGEEIGSRDFILDEILSVPMNDVFILDHVRCLTLEQTLYLLWYLLYLMMSADDLRTERPNIYQVVDWICILLDAHFNQLVVTKDEWTVALLDELSQQITFRVKKLQ